MISIPTTAELYADILTNIETEFGVSVPTSGVSMLRALAAADAATLKLFYYAIANVQKNIWCDTAESEAVGGTLERFGRVKLDRLPYPATAGQYTVSVTGTAAAVIPALTTFISDDDSLNPGFLFILDAAYTMTGSGDTITLRALTAGTESLLAVSDTLTATAPIVNVDQTATVTAITVDPISAETIEEYRDKVVQAYQLEPQGGAPADYRLWGLDAAGTRQIYPYAVSGASCEIDVFVEALPDDSTDGHGTPTSTILAEVEADIAADPDTGIGRKPLGVFAVNVQAIDALPVVITINSGGTITAAQQTLINAALDEWAYDIRPFIAGIDAVASRNDTMTTYGIGTVVIDTIGTVVMSSITMTVDGGGSVSSYLFDNGEIPYISSVVYV